MRFSEREVMHDVAQCVEEGTIALTQAAAAGVIRGGPSRLVRKSMTPIGAVKPPKA